MGTNNLSLFDRFILFTDTCTSMDMCSHKIYLKRGWIFLRVFNFGQTMMVNRQLLHIILLSLATQ